MPPRNELEPGSEKERIGELLLVSFCSERAVVESMTSYIEIAVQYSTNTGECSIDI